MANQFFGMTDETFPYKEYETVRENLAKVVNSSFTVEDRRFLLSVKDVEPDWSIYDFSAYPAIAWKLQNLKELKDSNPGKHNSQYEALKKKLETL